MNFAVHQGSKPKYRLRQQHAAAPPRLNKWTLGFVLRIYQMIVQVPLALPSVLYK